MAIGQVQPHAASPNDNKQLYWRDMVTGATGLVSGEADDGVAGNGRIQPADAGTDENDMSRNGRYVVFRSFACTLDADDTCGSGNKGDVFLYDRTTDDLARVSETVDDGDGGNGASNKPHVSQCGRFVVFESTSTNLEAVPLYDTTALGNCPPGGPALNLGLKNLFVLDRGGSNLGVDPDPANNDPNAVIEWISIGWRVGGAADRCSEPQADCEFPTMSDDGGRIAFQSRANNLVPGVDLSSFFPGGVVPKQVYVWDRTTQATTLVSQDWGSATLAPGNDTSQQPEISGDGRYVTFATAASNLEGPLNDQNGYWDVLVVDLDAAPTPTVQRVTVRENGAAWRDDIFDATAKNPAISDRGRFIAYSYWLDPELLSDSLPICEYRVDSLQDGLLWDRDLTATGGSTFIGKAPDGAGGSKQENGFSVFPAAFSDAGEYLVLSTQADDYPLTAGELADTNGRDASGGPIFPTCILSQNPALDDPCNPGSPLPCNDVTGQCPCGKEGQDVVRRRVWTEAP